MGFNPGVTESYGYGQQIHNVLTEIHLRALRGDHLSGDEVDQLLDTRFHLRYTRDGPLLTLKTAAKLSLKRFFNEYPDHAKYVLEAEKPFEFVDSESGALITGTIDLLQKVDETPAGERKMTPVGIVDFKTHSWRKTSDFSRDRQQAANQLRLYALAVQAALHMEPLSARVHFLGPKELPEDLKNEGVLEKVEVNIGKDQLDEALHRVRRTVGKIKDNIREQKFELKVHKEGHCQQCDFRLFCPGYQQWERIDQTTPRPLTPDEDRELEITLTEQETNARTTAERT